MIDNSKEYIVCAAIWYESGDKFVHTCKNIDHGIIVFGLRHSIYEVIIRLYPDYKETQDTHQGFLTSHNRFVERDEALKISVECGQVDKDDLVNNEKWLYSEDLY
jgi:hypothetical protein